MADQGLICNTSPLLYLGRVGRTDLLPALFEPVYVPDIVALELDAGRLIRPDTVDPRRLPWVRLAQVTPELIATLPANRLGAGERAVLAYARTQEGCLLCLDDLQARQLANQLGLRVVGTIGIVLRAKRAGLLQAAMPILDSLRNQGFRITPDLYAEALQLAGEELE